MTNKRIGLVIGSLRRESVSRRLAAAMKPLAPAGWTITELAIGELPLYNADLEAATPAGWAQLRADVRACDGFLFVVPEYNRSIPGALKNAIDVASKPTGQNCWPGKPAFVIAQSTGPLGGLAGSFALKQTLVGAGAAVLAHPEVYLSKVATLFDTDGNLLADTQAHLRGALAAFDSWIARFQNDTPKETKP